MYRIEPGECPPELGLGLDLAVTLSSSDLTDVAYSAIEP
jgi:hypothetical protein